MNSTVNFRVVLKVLSSNLIITGVALLSCVGLAINYAESFMPFIWSAVISLTLGLFFYILTRNQSEDLRFHKKDAYLTVTLSWFFIALMGSLPYLFSGAIPRFTNAFFESVSGFTTTGSSILTLSLIHISEPTRLGMISYAVFCLKKKKNK